MHFPYAADVEDLQIGPATGASERFSILFGCLYIPFTYWTYQYHDVFPHKVFKDMLKKST